MLDPERYLPIAHEGDRKGTTELFCGCLQIAALDGEKMARLPNLETLWLNDNLLTKLQGLDANFRLKHLYLHNNAITTVLNPSCSLKHLKHLETLQLQNNQLQDLKATLAVLSKLTSLRKLCLSNNPLANEGMYREATIFAIPTLTFLDTSDISWLERNLATKFFTAKRIEKKFAFGTVPRIYDKPPLVAIGEPCEGEIRLRATNAASLRRREIDATREGVLQEQRASRPGFTMSYAASPTGLLSKALGVPTTGHAAFEFMARGRVPQLLINLRFLSMTDAGRRAAISLAEIGLGDGSQAKVHVAVADSMGVLSAAGRSITSREVEPKLLRDEHVQASLQHEAFLFDSAIYPQVYDAVQQREKLGRLAEVSIELTLKEVSTGTDVGIVRVPLLPILHDHTEKTYPFVREPLHSPLASDHAGRKSTRAKAHGAAAPSTNLSSAGHAAGSGGPIGYLTFSISTDWGLANTTAKEYGNSAFVFARERLRAASSSVESSSSLMQPTGAGAAPTAGSPTGGPTIGPTGAIITSDIPLAALSPTKPLPKRLARDLIVLKSLPRNAAAPSPLVPSHTLSAHGGHQAGIRNSTGLAPAIQFDAERYAKYERAKKVLESTHDAHQAAEGAMIRL